MFFFVISCLPHFPALREQSRGFPHAADLFLLCFSPKSLYSYVFMVLGFYYGLLLLNGPICNFSYIPMYSWFWASLMGCCCLMGHFIILVNGLFSCTEITIDFSLGGPSLKIHYFGGNQQTCASLF